ncbi:phage portal protein [Sulfitobacter dubius]|uniref:phage portal protein n=1 Tax=Sulfitobacter dubius TaxID=218673 RepID=UPI002942B2F5|nr:phage portal protein [Sulfitobacter dubius]WOI30051.1 phage portal protein [Sulfitobacter dubius]
MGILNLFRRPAAESKKEVQASVPGGAVFSGLDDPALLEFMRTGGGGMTESGAHIDAKSAMKNTTILRCVSLIAFSIGMLPLHMHRKADKSKASDHPLFRVLHRKPNAWQTAFEFRSLIQQRALTDGDAFAMIVRSGPRVMQLVPIAGERVTVKQRDDWALEYVVTRGSRGPITLPQSDVFHLRYGLSDDGITGLSLVKQSAEAIGLALQAEKSAARMFRNGMIIGGALKHKEKLSPEAYERLKASMNDDAGAENAHKWKILEEGMDLVPNQHPGRDGQGLENRKHQIEETARPFGVPRPLLGVDDTSWGSGIDVLGQFFVRYGLNPWFEAWQQAIERSLLTEREADEYEVKFNAGALLRGSMKDQAEFFAKGLGAGGHTPWLHPDEPREWMDLERRNDLPAALGQQKIGGQNEPA